MVVPAQMIPILRLKQAHLDLERALKISAA
jgi:hypothetical protein